MRRLLSVMACVLLSASAAAQNLPPASDGGPPDTEAPADNAAPVTPAPNPAPDTRIIELRTAGYYELVARAQELGLPVTGGVPELRASVAQAMGVTLPPESEPQGRTLTIDTAEQAGLVTVDAPGDGKLLRLSGGLQVTLVDNDKKVTHVIEAGELWYDQANEEMTARGNVVYTMIRESSREVFKGESLTFRLSDSQGVFYSGASDRSRTVGDQTLTFRYGGDAIRRSAGDMVVLDSGTITSSLGKDPYYRIKAKKIWVLAPGEWGLQDAVLYLGRIPVLYFPFFFQPGDDFWFNPVLAFPDAGDRRGTSLQTTTYIFGSKVKDQSPLSFLQVADSDEGGDKVPRGLFLVKGTPSESKVPKDWTLKVMADFYSNLGFLSSVDANLPNWGGLKIFHAFGGIGFTRSVDTTGLPFNINPFQPELDPWAQSDWNSSLIGGVRVPFRWGGQFAVDAGWGSASMEYYSDPLLFNDLTGNRSENFSVFSLLGMGPAKPSAVATAKSNLNWTSALNLPPLTAGASLLWGTVSVPADVSTAHPNSPGNTYYVPSQLTLPQVTLGLSGTLWPIVSKPKATPESGLIAPDIKPADTPAAASADAAVPDTDLAAPGILDPVTLSANDHQWATGVTWSLQPTIKTDTRFNNNTATQSLDQNPWAVQSSRWMGAYDGKLAMTTGWSDSSLTTTEALNLHQQIQDTLFLAKGIDSQSYDQQDAQQTSSLFSQNLTSAWKPWFAFKPLRDSTLQYNLATTLWKETDAGTQLFDGTKRTVTEHQAAATAVWYLYEDTPTLKATAGWQDNLPPLDPLTTLSGRFDAASSWASASTTAVARRSTTGWTFDPWESTAQWTPLADFSLGEDFQYDVKNQYPLLSSTTLKAWGWTAQYNHQRTTAYTYDIDGRTWVAGQQDFLPAQLSFGYNLDLPPVDWWYHRNVLAARVAATWPINLQQYSQMPMTINYTVSYKLLRLVDFQITEGVSNQTAYRYIPFLANSFGPGAVRQVNVFQDLWDSISIWDQDALKRTSFKMTNLTIALVHYLDDWQVKLDYTGSPQLAIVAGIQQFQWTGTLTLTVSWYPIPELKTQMQVDKTGLNILRNTQEPVTSTPAATQ